MSIWDIRFSGSKKRPLTFDEALKASGFAVDEWITMKGTHIEVGEGGEILHGAQGKFKNINDVPRKTVKQREGESIEQTHERAREVFAKQDAEKAAAQGKAEADRKAERDRQFKESRAALKETRLKRDWNADPPAAVEDWFLKKEARAGNLSQNDLYIIGAGRPTLKRQTEKALLIRWHDDDSHTAVSAWVPKSVCMSYSDIEMPE